MLKGIFYRFLRTFTAVFAVIGSGKILSGEIDPQALRIAVSGAAVATAGKVIRMLWRDTNLDKLKKYIPF